MNSAKRLILFALAAVVIVCGLALYGLSGLPKPQRISQQARERSSYNDWRVIRSALTEQEWAEASMDVNEVRGRIKNRLGTNELSGRFIVPGTNAELGRIVFKGQASDELGMVFVLTDKGYILRVPASAF